MGRLVSGAHASGAVAREALAAFGRSCGEFEKDHL
jgi:hypothetical protein